MARIHLVTRVHAPAERVFDLARDIDFHQRSMRHAGERAVAGRTSGLIEPGETVTWQARQFGFTWRLSSRVTQYERPARFVDEQVSGPFRRFRHEQRFEELPGGGTEMVDEWEHALPFGVLGRIVDGVLIARHMRNLLRVRSALLAEEAERS